MNERSIYQIVETAPLWQRIVGYGVGVVFVARAGIYAFHGVWPPAIIAGCVGAFVIAFFRVLSSFQIRVTPTEVRFGYEVGRNLKSIDRADIADVSVERRGVLERTGLSLRLALSGRATHLFAYDYRPVVALRKCGGETYYFGVHEPQALARALAVEATR